MRDDIDKISADLADIRRRVGRMATFRQMCVILFVAVLIVILWFGLLAKYAGAL